MDTRGMVIKNILSEYHIIFLSLIAILLPFQTFGPRSGFNPMPLLIAIWGLIWLVDMSIRWQWPKFRLTMDTILPVGFVMISILSLLFSQNLSDGWSKIQVRLSLLFIPLFLINRTIDRNAVRILLRSFIISSAFASLILVIRSLIRYAEQGWHAFFYTEFSFFLHPSYFALYLLICIIILIMLDDILAWVPWVRFTLSILFFLIIFLTSSRAGLLAIMFVAVYSLIKSPLIKRAIHRYILIGLLLLMSFTAMFLNYRTNLTAIDATNALMTNGNPVAVMESVKNKSSPLRIMIWSSALDLIKNNWLLGYGIGDVQDELTASYYQNGFHVPALKQLNAHDQYLQSILEAGVLGLIALLFLLLPWSRLAEWRGSFIGIAILAAFGIHLLFESMLNTQSGVIILAWIIVLLPHVFDHESNKRVGLHEAE